MAKRRNLVVLLCVTFLGAGVASAELVDGLVASWSFDSDFTATNGGSAYNLAAYNGATAGESGGKYGNAAKFERANEEYAFTTGNVLTVGGDHSYSVWYKSNVSDLGSDRYWTLETTRDNTVGTGVSAYSASFGLGEGDTASQDGQVFTKAGGSGYHLYFEGANTSQVWHNVIVTYDADGGDAAGNGRHTVYLDGVYIGAFDNPNPLESTEGLVIGGHRNGTGRNWDGLIDDVGFWNRVLTASEITQLQTSAIPEPTTMGLLGLGGLVMIRFRRK